MFGFLEINSLFKGKCNKIVGTVYRHLVEGSGHNGVDKK
jgi:hypothetical protein